VTTKAEVANAKADRAVEALSGPINADAVDHGWTDESREAALRHLSSGAGTFKRTVSSTQTMLSDGVGGCSNKVFPEASSRISWTLGSG
jgi:hypothetical protein